MKPYNLNRRRGRDFLPPAVVDAFAWSFIRAGAWLFFLTVLACALALLVTP